MIDHIFRGIMCPLYPLHIALLYLCLALPLLLAVVDGADTLATWQLGFSHRRLGNETDKLRELTSKQFDVMCQDCVQDPASQYKLKIRNQDPNIAFLQQGSIEQVRHNLNLYQFNNDKLFCRMSRE